MRRWEHLAQLIAHNGLDGLSEVVGKQCLDFALRHEYLAVMLPAAHFQSLLNLHQLCTKFCYGLQQV